MWCGSGIPEPQYRSWDVNKMFWMHCGIITHNKGISGRILYLDRKVDLWECWHIAIMAETVA